ncbi:DUF262 domain-containing protein [Pseudoalteromonas ruthenica]|uniref:DUF262 domain-containing protein n=1 Tax=Pseudoalteromonas ruthenica TaxID=151081 RepID=UPI00110A6FDA|nr:DUF262 domain-containing protein [Pseudoalteromonas ruthenica]TMO49997.1 hypothetical protein CWC24_00835 [Pseudoalteromonas ruthenica]TMO52373.1 hypothetical protein CWC23_02595 [Pseudoalteromonas ruthenica]
MKISISEPDIGSVVNRIKSKVIDLQPDFQRGDVWAVNKRKKLIDSILRGWQIPPVHVIRQDELFLEVLDGQQRLRAIYGFFNDEFSISSKFEPLDSTLEPLHGLTYSKLPENVKRRIDYYSIRILEVYDYKAGETGELFNRLNQSLNLTAAEKRNAQVGDTRTQIKTLSKYMYELDLDSKFIGFSNTRLAHDDLFARLCFYLEKGGVRASITDNALYEKYRKDETFSDEIIDAVKYSLSLVSKIKSILLKCEINVHITKASFFSWLLFISQMYLLNGDNNDEKRIINTFISSESKRYNYKENILEKDRWSGKFSLAEIMPMFSLYNERASSRVMTTSSLLIRDWVISFFFFIENESENTLDERRAKEVNQIIEAIKNPELDLKSKIEKMAETGKDDD